MPAFDSDQAPFYELRKNRIDAVTLDVFPKAPHEEIALVVFALGFEQFHVCGPQP